MNTLETLKTLMDGVLHLNGASAGWTAETRLLGSLPELDSLAVVELIMGIQTGYSLQIEDDEINADVFATLGSLSEFVALKTRTSMSVA